MVTNAHRSTPFRNPYPLLLPSPLSLVVMMIMIKQVFRVNLHIFDVRCMTNGR